MGKSTISMAMFNSYVKLPEGSHIPNNQERLKTQKYECDLSHGRIGSFADWNHLISKKKLQATTCTTHAM